MARFGKLLKANSTPNTGMNPVRTDRLSMKSSRACETVCMRTLCKSACALLLGLSLAAIAQEADESAEQEQIEEIAIVASRTVADVIGVESIKLDDIPPQFTLTDSIRTLTGAAVSQSGATGSVTQTRVRGAEANHVKVLLNGVPLNLHSADLNFAALSPVGIDRIVALNGPRSAVWGNHALAGVIHLSTPTIPDKNRIYMDAGSQAAWSAGADAGTRLRNTDIGVHFAKRTTEGTNTSYIGDENDGFDQTTTHIGYRSEFEAFTAQGFVRRTSSLSEYDPIPRDGDRHIEVSNNVVAQKFNWTTCNTVDWQANASRTTSRLLNFVEQDETNSWRGVLAQVGIEGAVRISAQQRASFALESMREEFEQRAPVAPWGDPNYAESIGAYGLAAEYVLELPVWQLHGSIRQDMNTEFGDAFTWQATAMQRFNNWAWSYAIGVGTKNPTFIERFGYTPANFLGNQYLKPETALQHQVAIERAAENRSLTLAIYASTLNDEINGFSYDVEQNQFTAVNLSSDSSRRGAELRFEQSLGSATLYANYAYIDSREADEPEIRRPNHLANLGLRHQLTSRLRMRSSLHWSSNQLDRDFSTFPATVVTLDSHFLAAASWEYDVNATFAIYGNIENLFDTEYEHVYGYRNPGRRYQVGMKVTL